MASRRFLSSLLRSPLTRSPPEFQFPTYVQSLFFSNLTSRLSPIPVTGFPQTNAFSRVQSGNGLARLASFQHDSLHAPQNRFLSTGTNSADSSSQDSTILEPEVPPRIKFKRLDKTARHIMQILDKEAVEEVKAQKEVPDIRPGYTVQLKVEVPENKRRISIIKGIVIARRNAGLNSTFMIRRTVAGTGLEYLFPLYSPNIKEIKVLDKKKVRRAKLYYARKKKNALK
ncbi:large ribosomal subunit protein bL19c-like [Cicer arietinum]|uniref:50S ribosomal protein L19, chloroplastic-like n=1 Tax=Cicer arietinum TaxID=3827 RepID=A0A1S2YLY3_CICAR|nr:50S ribosomal protein L19, chloroplastic-like [Cicer arietinum]